MITSGNKVLKFVLYVLFLSLCWASLRAEVVYATEAPEYNEALKLFESGDTGKAIELMKHTLSEHPDNAEAYDRLGYIHLKRGEIDEALNAFNAGLKINPRLHSAKTGKGFALLRKGDTKGAEAAFKDALTLNPTPAMTHYGLGLLYEGLKDYENAVIHYKEGIKKYKAGRQ
jgi:tetratricopeptide (TPR) repeat protein